MGHIRHIVKQDWTILRATGGMSLAMNNPYVTVHVDLARLRRNVEQIRELVKVPVLAVVKSDAYGLGAARVSEALADLVGGFCVFSLHEAVEADLWRRTSMPVLAM